MRQQGDESVEVRSIGFLQVDVEVLKEGLPPSGNEESNTSTSSMKL